MFGAGAIPLLAGSLPSNHNCNPVGVESEYCIGESKLLDETKLITYPFAAVAVAFGQLLITFASFAAPV